MRRTIEVHCVGQTAYVDSALGSTALAEVPRFPDPSAAQDSGSLLAPVPGRVVRVLVEAGAAVAAGQPLMVLEAMKMEHTITAAADGTVGEVHVAPGDQVDIRQVLALTPRRSALAQDRAQPGAKVSGSSTKPVWTLGNSVGSVPSAAASAVDVRSQTWPVESSPMPATMRVGPSHRAAVVPALDRRGLLRVDDPLLAAQHFS